MRIAGHTIATPEYSLPEAIDLFAGLGRSRKEDTLPFRVQHGPLPDFGAAHYLPDLEAKLNDYYAHRGWTQDGISTRAKLEALGLGGDGAGRGL